MMGSGQDVPVAELLCAGGHKALHKPTNKERFGGPTQYQGLKVLKTHQDLGLSLTPLLGDLELFEAVVEKPEVLFNKRLLATTS